MRIVLLTVFNYCAMDNVCKISFGRYVIQEVALASR